MLVSGGKLLAIDRIVSDNYTISGDGVEHSIGVDTDVIATQESLLNTSSVLNTNIQTVSANFDNYYTKSETSGSDQLAEKFDIIEQSIVPPYELQSMTPDTLFAGISANAEDTLLYVVSAAPAQDVLVFDGTYDPETNKAATVETVTRAISTVKPIVLKYNEAVTYSWEELQSAAPNVYVIVDGVNLYDLSVVTYYTMVFRQHTATKVYNDEHSQITVTELQLFRDLSWNTDITSYSVTDPWSDNDTGINVSIGRISVNVDDSTVKINENNQLYAPDTFQHVIYNTTKWAEIDFSKTLVLEAPILEDAQTSSSLCEMTDDHVTWLTIASNEVYFVKLTNTDTWSITKLEISGEKYTAGTGLVLNQNEFSIDETVVATKDIVSSVSGKLSTDIGVVSANFDNYYLKTETSGADQLSNEFDAIKKSIVQPYDIQSLTPSILYATVSANEDGSNSYVVSATNSAQVELEFDGTYDPVTNKVATVETVKKSIVQPVILTYDVAPTQTYSELLELAKTSRLYVLTDTEIVRVDSFTEDAILFTYVDSSQQLNCYTLSSDLTWNHTVTSLANDHKVAIAAGATPDYLQQVLVSDAEEITFTKVDNQLRVGLNISGESDPKLTTINESQINDSTSNYGWWNTAYDPPAWGDSGVNCIIYRHKRTSDAQGSLTLCRCAFTNNWGMTRPVFRIGIFDLDMNLLGSSDYFVYDTSITQFVGKLYNDTLNIAQGANVELEIPIHEETVGALSINRNTRYVIELVSCGLAFAAKTQSGTSVTSNYTYDYALGNNVMLSQTKLDWWTSDSGKQQADKVPYLSFGASTIRSSSV